MFYFYYHSMKYLPMILIHIIIFLLIVIGIINNKLYDAVNRNDNIKFKENLKIQKGLIWTNFSIITLLFLYLLAISFYFFRSRFRGINVITSRRKPLFYINIILSCVILIYTGLTYYMNKGLSEINIFNAKEELKKIYIIIPLISIISICLLFYNTYKIQNIITGINFNIRRGTFDNAISVTRTNSPSRSNSLDDDDIPPYFRDDHPNRYSPPYLEDMDN